MIPNSVLNNAVTARDKKIWLMVRDALFKLMIFIHPKTKNKWDMESECHSICRGLHHHFPELKVIDGTYLGLQGKKVDGKKQFDTVGCYHSWLKTVDGAIIDPYPVGCIPGNAILVPNQEIYGCFGFSLYEPDPETTKAKVNRKVIRQSLVIARLLHQSKDVPLD